MSQTYWLNLGCGNTIIPGFTNVDMISAPHIHVQANVDDLSKFYDEQAEYIYASHVLEYFHKSEADIVIQEWARVLCIGGMIRIAVPDLDALWAAYKAFGIDTVLGPLYGRMEVDGLPIYHKTAYNFESLKGLLMRHGFRHVRKYDWRETIHRDYDDWSQSYIPHMDKEKGILISLNVEATKEINK